ncbi:50S ribosomal protein L11 methyltransferase [Ferruginibacter lapsinanis]|uniref:50S ribosomal protein L11 methyltransferase n=1 Tax=Ferruginibacter lapsinanis TaxID=563172 RepID=UPI001E535270|nr:50S ribosomal protein L11 methyltransferase [Ferruginibacter lapsinanis]UEG49127.1 50S ribosomal protein L11 methyltransferase [Ferruginibacter lapsinanis]
MNFLQFDFETQDQEQSEQLIALLSEQGFDGFEEDGNTLLAFIPESKFDVVSFEKTLEMFSILAYSKTELENINWNKRWEENFDPVVVDDFVAIRAHFHHPIKNVQHEIIITPKMSFGTGHHATTHLMIQLMRKLDISGKEVLDFGTGTGVLAILAQKLGASKIVAIDYDEWSVTNTLENIEKNGSLGILVEQKDAVPDTGKYDIILANINLNVILDNISAMQKIMPQGAKLLLSGLLSENEEEVKDALKDNYFKYLSTSKRGDWIAMLAEKL